MIPDSKMPSDLQKLWEELNEGDAERHEQDLKNRLAQRAKLYSARPQGAASYNEDEIIRVSVVVNRV